MSVMHLVHKGSYIACRHHSAFSVIVKRGIMFLPAPSVLPCPFYFNNILIPKLYDVLPTALEFAETRSTISPEVGCRLQQHEEPDSVPLPMLFANVGNTLVA
jgi:hypothetical protein